MDPKLVNFKANTNELIEKLQKEALKFYHTRKLAKAKKVCELILQVSPVNVVALEISGVICLVERRFDDAVAVYAELIAVNPKTSNAYVNRGIALKALGEFDLAIQSFDVAISLNRKDAKAYYNRANTLIALKKFDIAVSDYKSAIILDPNFSDAYLNLGCALIENMQFSDALEKLEKAVLLNPKNDNALYSRGKAFHKIGKYGEAIRSFDDALAVNKSHFEASNDKGLVLHELQNYEEALINFNRTILINAGYAQAYNNRGNTLTKLRRFDEALASFDKAIALNPVFVEAYSNRGNVLKELGRLDAALASCDKAIVLNPDFAEAFSIRGIVMQELRRLDEALSSYSRAIALKPDFFDAQSSLARLPKGMIPDQFASLLLRQWVCPSEKAIEAKALFLKANLLRHLGKYQESFEVLLNANLLNQKKFEEKIEGWREDNRRIQKELRDWQAIVRDGEDADAPKLLFIFGASCSGKTTIEFSIPENEVIKRGFEGRSALLAIKDLQDLRLELDQLHQKSTSEVAKRVIDSLFYREADATGKITHQLVTNTNPFLVKAAHFIFDLYPNSYFVFVYRDSIDNAADIFSTEYSEPLTFACQAQTALEYVNWYHAVSDELVGKMGGRALKFDYENFIKNAELGVKSIAKLVGVDLEADPSQLDMRGRTDTSVYRKLFMELLERKVDWNP